MPLLSISDHPTGTPVDPARLNADFDAVENAFNGSAVRTDETGPQTLAGPLNAAVRRADGNARDVLHPTIGMAGDGTTDDGPKLTALTAGTYELPATAQGYHVGTAVTLARGVRLRFAADARIVFGASGSLAFAAAHDPEAGPWQIFDLSAGGSVTGLRRAFPEWFHGALGEAWTAATVSTTAGSTTVSITGATLTAADVGKTIHLPLARGRDTDGTPGFESFTVLVTTITAVDPGASTLTVARAADAATSGEPSRYGWSAAVPIKKALDAAREVVFMDGRTYEGDGTSVVVPAERRIAASRQVTFRNLSFTQGNASAGTIDIEGGRYLADIPNHTYLDNPLNVWGNGVVLSGFEVEDPDGTGPTTWGNNWGTGCYVRRDAERCTIRDFRIRVGDADSIAIQGNRVEVAHGEISGNDDGIVIKAGNATGTGHIVVHHVRATHCADIVATGSEISGPVHDLAFHDLQGVRVSRGAYLKAGKLPAGSGGFLEQVRVHGVQVHEPLAAGTTPRFMALAEVDVRRDTQVRDVLMGDLMANGVRGASAPAKGLLFQVNDRKSGDDPLPVGLSRIDTLEVNGVLIRDADDGAAYGLPERGYPLSSFVYLEELFDPTQTSRPSIRNVKIRNLRGRGCGQNGIHVDLPSAHEVLLENVEIDTYANNAGGATGYGLRVVAGKVRVRNLRLLNPGVRAGDPINIAAGATLIAEATPPMVVEQLVNDSTATVRRALFTAPERTYAYEVLLLSDTTLPQSDTDYFTFTLERYRGGVLSATLGSATTRLTGGLSLQAHVPVAFSGTYFGSAAFLEQNDVLVLRWSYTGTLGSSRYGLRAVVRHCPY